MIMPRADSIRFLVFTLAACALWVRLPGPAASEPEGSRERVEFHRAYSGNGGEGAVPLDLESSIAIAVSRSYELSAIRAGSRVFDLTLRERLRDYFPSLALSYFSTQETARRDVDSRQQRLRLESDLVLYDGGRRGLAYDIASLKSVLARNDYRIALNRLIAEVLSAYLQILQNHGAIAIHGKTLEHGRMQLMLIKKELELGETTRFNVMEIEAKVEEIELNRRRAIDDYENSLNRYKLLLKVDWRQPLRILGDIDKDFVLSPLDAGFDAGALVATALRNRKEVESSDVEFAISAKTHRINSLYYLPKLSIGFFYGLSGEQSYADRFIPREKEWGLNFKVTTALFGSSGSLASDYTASGNGNARSMGSNAALRFLDDMGYRRAIVESGINLATAGEKRKEARQQIATEVVSSIMALENAWKMIEISKRQLELYDAQLVIERLKADMGESRRYDLIKKEIERGEAAIAYLDSRARYLTTSSLLELAMGVDIGYLRLSHYTGRRGR